MKSKNTKLWKGRFHKSVLPAVESFTQSISFDKRLAPYDIKASMAHVRMLSRCRIIPARDAGRILKGLEKIAGLIRAGRLPLKTEHEDIHMQIEAFLTGLAGEAGKKLHTARSRNDQVLVDMMLYLKDTVRDIIRLLKAVQEALLKLSRSNRDLVIPGYTHLQQAQPVLASHYFLAYFFKVQRDRERFQGCLESLDVLPLGSGALAGVNYGIDRHYTAKLLGFSRVSENSMDTVSNRDFIIEFIFNCALSALHFSQLAEDLIIWNTGEFGFIEIDDAYTTGSSIMPNKKNPDVLELIRGRSALLTGSLNSILLLIKGLPLTYNRDLQEDKVILFGAVDVYRPVLAILPGLLSCIRFKKESLARHMGSGFMLATDIADFLVKRGVPFRTAHGIVGRIVRYAADRHKSLFGLTLKEWRKVYPAFPAEALSLLDYHKSTEMKRSYGSTSRQSVARQIRTAERMLSSRSGK